MVPSGIAQCCTARPSASFIGVLITFILKAGMKRTMQAGTTGPITFLRAAENIARHPPRTSSKPIPLSSWLLTVVDALDTADAAAGSSRRSGYRRNGPNLAHQLACPQAAWKGRGGALGKIRLFAQATSVTPATFRSAIHVTWCSEIVSSWRPRAPRPPSGLGPGRPLSANWAAIRAATGQPGRSAAAVPPGRLLVRRARERSLSSFNCTVLSDGRVRNS